MTTDHWLTLALHKNGRFYTECFSDDTRQDGESDCEMSRVAKPITHITSCLWGTECLGVSQIQEHTFFFLLFFFFNFASAHSAPTGLMSSTITVSVRVT